MNKEDAKTSPSRICVALQNITHFDNTCNCNLLVKTFARLRRQTYEQHPATKTITATPMYTRYLSKALSSGALYRRLFPDWILFCYLISFHTISDTCFPFICIDNAIRELQHIFSAIVLQQDSSLSAWEKKFLVL